MSDLLRKYKSLYSSTTNTFSTGESVTITPASVVGLPTDTEITLTFDRVDSSGTKTPSKMERIRGTVVGSNFVVSSGGRAVEGTEQTHTSPVVEMVWNADDWNDMVDWGLVEHGQDGKHTDATVTTLKATGAEINTGTEDAKIVTPKAIADSYLGGATSNIQTQINARAGADGWTIISGTFTYASATTINVASGAASIYSKGDKLRFQNNDSGTWLYVYVITVADTLLTVVGDTVPNATLTDAYYSHQESPLGFPDWFAWTPTYTGFSSNPTHACFFNLKGRTCSIKSYPTGSGTSNAASFRISLPIAPSTNGIRRSYAYGWGVDNGSPVETMFKVSGNDDATNLILSKGLSESDNWTTSGSKYAYIPPMFYEIA